MLEKIPSGPRINKLRIIQLLEADLNQVLRSAFARNISKLAQETPGIISEHQYGRSHQTYIKPVLNKLLTVQILIQKKTNWIVFDNNAKGYHAPHCQWYCTGSATTNRLLQDLIGWVTTG
jgi:hypothetical protein